MSKRDIIKKCCNILSHSSSIYVLYKQCFEEYLKLQSKSFFDEPQYSNQQFNAESFIGDNTIKDHVRKLDSTLLDQFERAFDADFSDVKIHIGSYADKITREANASAVTIGNDIYFAGGKYSPDTEDGIQLLGHELQHVVQFKNQDRMKYFEDFEKLEYEAGTTERDLNSLRLHNIKSPILNKNPDVENDNENFADAFDDSAVQSGSSVENLDDFSNRSDKPKYRIILKSGESFVIGKKERDIIFKEFKARVLNWLDDIKIQLTEEEYNAKLLKFLKLIKKRGY